MALFKNTKNNPSKPPFPSNYAIFDVEMQVFIRTDFE
jgi:hypothetical protein